MQFSHTCFHGFQVLGSGIINMLLGIMLTPTLNIGIRISRMLHNCSDTTSQSGGDPLTRINTNVLECCWSAPLLWEGVFRYCLMSVRILKAHTTTLFHTIL